MIVILVMAEEKWEEANFLRKQIESRGHKTVILDMGLLGKPKGPCDITREKVIAASGRDAKEVAAIRDRGERMPVIVSGGIQKVRELYANNELDGLICLGGGTGTQMGTDIMKGLPFGVPKFAISTIAGTLGFSNLAFDTSDITMINTVVEFTGINNDLIKNILVRSAGAICGMVEEAAKAPFELYKKGEKPRVALTQLGLCEVCAVALRKLLEEKGYQVIGFHTNSVGDRAMEEMVERLDIFDGVIDLSPSAVGEELFDFARKAGPHRLEAAGKKGLPQVICPCGVNQGHPLSRNYRARPELKSRKTKRYDARRTFIRLSGDELILVADTIADKLNKSIGPVKFIIPLGGWSSVDKRGMDFYDGELDRVFVNELKSKLRPDTEVREVDTDLDTPEFAEAVFEAFNDVMAGARH